MGDPNLIKDRNGTGKCKIWLIGPCRHELFLGQDQ